MMVSRDVDLEHMRFQSSHATFVVHVDHYELLLSNDAALSFQFVFQNCVEVVDEL